MAFSSVFVVTNSLRLRRFHEPGKGRLNEMRTATATDKDALMKRLHRIEGQVRGIERMVDEDRYCIDILTQIGAVRPRSRARFRVLDDHVTHCVHGALAAGDAKKPRPRHRNSWLRYSDSPAPASPRNDKES